MTARRFHCCSVRYGDRMVRGVRLNCRCGASEALPFNGVKFGGGDDADRMARTIMQKFRERGWIVGARPQDDRCRNCNEAFAARAKNNSNVVLIKPKKEAAGTMPGNGATKGGGEAPRQMSREDRRIVFEKLNEVYVSEQVGYQSGWTDRRVAEDLGVPRAWVGDVREQMFGPHGFNCELAARMEEAAKVIDESRALMAEFAEAKISADDALRRAKEISAKVDRLGGAIETLRGELSRAEQIMFEAKKAVA